MASNTYRRGIQKLNDSKTSPRPRNRDWPSYSWEARLDGLGTFPEIS